MTTVSHKTLAMAAFLLIAALPARAADAIGQIKTEAGAVTIVRGKTTLPVHIGDHVYETDTVVTGGDGSVGITFADNSMMSLGPKSKLALDEFHFDTTTHEGVFNASLKSGTLAVRSGDIVKQTPEAMHIRTPAALLGVRGTYFVVHANGDIL
jgi:hypothetical protein